MFRSKYVLVFALAIIVLAGMALYPQGTNAATNQPVPGLIEAESYSAMSGIQIEACSEGGQNIGWTDAGDWMDYSLNIQSTGIYSVEFRVASPYTNTRFELRRNTTVLATITVPNTGGFQTWTTVTANNISLTAGTGVILRVSSLTNGWNFNWLRFNLSGGATPTPTPTSTSTPTPTRIVTATPTQTATATPTRTATPIPGGNLALNKEVIVSSTENGGTPGSAAVDGDTGTRWSSVFSDPQWIYVDLGASYPVNRVVLRWEAAYGRSYTVQVSTNATSWSVVYSTTTGDGGIDDISFIATTARYVRIYGTVRATGYGYSLWEFEVYSSGGPTPTPTMPAGTATPTPTRPAGTATPTPTLPPGPTATPGPVDFGPNVYIYDPSMSMSTIQSQVDSIYAQQDDNQFGSQRYAFFFKPGAYNLNIPIGYYTSIIGLGQRPDDVTITGSVRCEADWMGGNATCNFWRTAENYSVVPTYSANPAAPPGTETWAASQAAPMRRVHIRGNLSLWDPVPPDYDRAWSSGGFIADSKVDGNIISASQQQYFTRNVQMSSWSGSNWNQVFLGDVGAPGDTWPSPPYTVIGQTPVIREKPFLYIDSAGKYFIFKPAIRTNAQGITWASGMGAGTSISIDEFYIAKPGVSAATLNTMLGQGKHLLFTPGIYQLSEPLQVNRADAIVMGIGLATLIPVNGTAAIKVADVDGVTIAGLLLDAGAINSPVLLEVGPRGSMASHAGNPIFIFDIFCRVGGAAIGKATNCVEINSHNTVVDHFWLWRADHGAGVGWNVNTTTNGLIVNGNNVAIYGLFVEHFHQYQVIWNGNGGRTYFYQSEAPYDAPNQAAWMNGTKNGWASYKVSDSVSTHEAWGLGVYCVYTVDTTIKLHSAIEAPVKSGVKFHHMVIVTLGYQGEITHVINELGGPVTNSGPMTAQWNEFP